jgi:hypothetical protein
VWLDISKDSNYISIEEHKEMMDGYDEVNRMLNGMVEKPEKFCPKPSKTTRRQSPVVSAYRLVLTA